jgi:hypothetical protein
MCGSAFDSCRRAESEYSGAVPANPNVEQVVVIVILGLRKSTLPELIPWGDVWGEQSPCLTETE